MQPAVKAVVLVGLLAIGAVGHAQRPERQHDVLVPGLGVRLREGWGMFFYRGCRYAVPATWRSTPGHDRAVAPDGSSISLWTLQVASWWLRKSQLKSAYSAERVVRDDSDSRLWIESEEDTPVRQVVAVSNGAHACAALVEIRNGSRLGREIVEAIAESVGPAQWSEDLNAPESPSRR
jgi:hypothetical protein